MDVAPPPAQFLFGTRVAVVGLGYVGLPLAHATVTLGAVTVGLDNSPECVDLLGPGARRSAT